MLKELRPGILISFGQVQNYLLIEGNLKIVVC